MPCCLNARGQTTDTANWPTGAGGAADDASWLHSATRACGAREGRSTLHRVFHPGDHGWSAGGLEPLRAHFRALGMAETEHDGGWLYWLTTDRRPALFATLHAHGSAV